MELQEILFAAGGIGGGGVVGWLLKNASFKAKAESTDKEHSEAIKGLIKANELQSKNNELQQKSIDNISTEQRLIGERILTFRENFDDYKKDTRQEFSEYKKAQKAENDKVNKTLIENTNTIAALDSTLKGLDNVLQMLFKKIH